MTGSALAYFIVALGAWLIGVVMVLVAVVSHRSIHARVSRKPHDTEATLDVDDAE